MRAKVIQKFHGKIGDIDIYDENIFIMVDYILDALDLNGFRYTDTLVEELIKSVGYVVSEVSDNHLMSVVNDVSYFLDDYKSFYSMAYGSDIFEPVNEELVRANEDHEHYDKMVRIVQSKLGPI